ncbi:hypothetical protein CDAR_508541 [Caerostris darwini]|uniref:Secreted protein n=1 Tax=Caerostris darwini TaxID=1538125 RepID=A0AAV4N089_9ARAC|nr:hypothetical protein CDAR_508541 [Caerostris darwini]
MKPNIWFTLHHLACHTIRRVICAGESHALISRAASMETSTLIVLQRNPFPSEIIGCNLFFPQSSAAVLKSALSGHPLPRPCEVETRQKEKGEGGRSLLRFYQFPPLISVRCHPSL